MNLFLLAWNLSNEKVPLVLSELDNMKAVYQLLDPNTIWSFGQGSCVFAASMHTANDAAAPRIYVKRSENQVVLNVVYLWPTTYLFSFISQQCINQPSCSYQLNRPF